MGLQSISPVPNPRHTTKRMYTWSLLCSSFLGNILEPLIRKQVIAEKDLQRRLQAEPWGNPSFMTWGSRAVS